MQQYKREPAVRVSVGQILAAQFSETAEGASLALSGGLARRVSILGIVVSKDDGSALVDDGTGQVRLRLFEPFAPDVGSFAFIIARPRKFFGEIYLVPEIARPSSSLWAQWHRLQIVNAPPPKVVVPVVEEQLIGREKVEIYKAVREIDQGRGADIEQVAAMAGFQGVHDIIQGMLRSGDLFEISPGRLKVLE